MPMTPDQLRVLVAVERSSSTLSVVATLILLATYCTFKRFRTLSNALIFYASFANLIANVACLMARDFIHNPNGAPCQLQAFMVQMFLQSDPLWSCAMAINVYLCIFRRYDAAQLRKMHWKYALFCYGMPFFPAMFCLFYRDRRGKMYGDATLWCWIDRKWSSVRIYCVYLPIWISIVVALAIYVRVGIVIWKVRADIKALEDSGDYTFNDTITSGEDVSVTQNNNLITIAEKPAESDSQTTTPPPESHPGFLRWDTFEIEAIHPPSASSYFNSRKASNYSQAATLYSKRGSSVSPMQSPLDPVYTHPSRLARPSFSSFSSHVTSTPAQRMDRLKWAYTKTALLFTVSILITWVPASINRVFGLTRPNQSSFVLNVICATVLPLQGFWNTVIFFAGSWGIVKKSWRRWRRKRSALRREKQELKEREAAVEIRRESDKTLVEEREVV